MKVLLVEDEPLIALELEERMLESDMEVIRATRGEDAVHLALREIPDVIVLDLGLPDISGLEVLKRLHAKGLRIPTIVLTGLRDSDTRHEIHQHGVSAYFQKPFEPRLLIARIHIVSKTSQK